MKNNRFPLFLILLVILTVLGLTPPVMADGTGVDMETRICYRAAGVLVETQYVQGFAEIIKSQVRFSLYQDLGLFNAAEPKFTSKILTTGACDGFTDNLDKWGIKVEVMRDGSWQEEINEDIYAGFHYDLRWDHSDVLGFTLKLIRGQGS